MGSIFAPSLHCNWVSNDEGRLTNSQGSTKTSNGAALKMVALAAFGMSLRSRPVLCELGYPNV